VGRRAVEVVGTGATVEVALQNTHTPHPLVSTYNNHRIDALRTHAALVKINRRWGCAVRGGGGGGDGRGGGGGASHLNHPASSQRHPASS
jgi:hypothetical protein